MSRRERIGVHLKYRLLVAAGVDEKDPRGGALSEWILQAAESCLAGELSIDRAALEIGGFRVGKNLWAEPRLLERIDEAAEEQELDRSRWLECAVFARLESERRAEPDTDLESDTGLESERE